LILGHPALRKLALMKLRGTLRRQMRRAKRLSGLLFMVVGLLLTGAWLFAVVPMRARAGAGLEPDLLRSAAQAFLMFFALMSLAGALSVRGLYLPQQEIERMFSIPVSRADLVRYRMQVDFARTLLGAVIFGFLAMGRMPNALHGFCGAFLSIVTLAVVRQFGSLLLGDVSGRIGRLLRGRRLFGTRVVLGLMAWAAIMLLIFGEDLLARLPGGGAGDWWRQIALHPFTQKILMPTRPWAEMMTATSARAFLEWTGLCVLLWIGLYELTARLPVDFRAQSLATSEEVAQRLRSLRRGGPFSGGRVSQAAAGRRIPWIFGRGPFGAVAWIKTASILRKARGTLAMSIFVLGIVTFGISVALQGEQEVAASVGPALIAAVGMVYLGGGMRFDFRSDLDRMEQIKAWPLGPSRLFLATVMPEVLLITLLVAAAILIRAAVLESFPFVLAITLGVLPFVALAWVALDNAVFLFAPVRFVPGQEGTLHHTGRTMVLLLLRLLLFLLTAALAGGAGAGMWFLGRDVLETGEGARIALAVCGGLAVLLNVDAALVHLGGRLLGRFDVARDRA